jgi:hypothetical protein
MLSERVEFRNGKGEVFFVHVRLDSRKLNGLASRALRSKKQKATAADGALIVWIDESVKASSVA